jgi:hypothetical protein
MVMLKVCQYDGVMHLKILVIIMLSAVDEELYSRIGLRDTLLQKVICRKLQLFGHICRMDGKSLVRPELLRLLKRGTN